MIEIKVVVPYFRLIEQGFWLTSRSQSFLQRTLIETIAANRWPLLATESIWLMSSAFFTWFLASIVVGSIHTPWKPMEKNDWSNRVFYSRALKKYVNKWQNPIKMEILGSLLGRTMNKDFSIREQDGDRFVLKILTTNKKPSSFSAKIPI